VILIEADAPRERKIRSLIHELTHFYGAHPSEHGLDDDHSTDWRWGPNGVTQWSLWIWDEKTDGVDGAFPFWTDPPLPPHLTGL
jgi:hypothetical protein